MILIPDVHISTKHGEKILALLEYIFANHNDQEVVFLGDYVYMFSYDRAMLLRLFDFFVKLYHQGRKVKIMSGNHDWLHGHFVFEEGKQAFDIISRLSNTEQPYLQFITQPYHRVNGNTLHIMLPYNDRLLEPERSEYYDPEAFKRTEYIETLQLTEALGGSARPGDQLSAKINTIVLNYYETNKNNFEHIVLYHHYYVANKEFPGVTARFGFQDAAIAPIFCKLPGLYLISGHIHEPFSYEQYLCCGSLWHTSNNELDECKYYFVGSAEHGFTAHMIHANPKISLERQSGQELDESAISTRANDVENESVVRMQGPLIDKVIKKPIPLGIIDLYLRTQELIEGNYAANEVMQSIASYKIIKRAIMQEDIFSSSISSDFRANFTDWKQLLSEYLKYKYPDQHDAYIDFMKVNGIV